MNTLTELDAARAIRDQIPGEGLFHEKDWRISPRAFPISSKFAGELDQLGFHLAKFVAACESLYQLSVKGRQPSWIADLLDRGKPRELVDLARSKSIRGQVPGVIRPDLILTDDGFVIAELDNVPGGIGLTAWFNNAYAALGEEVVGGTTGMLDGFERLVPGGDIVVSAEADTYRPEMLWLAEQLNARAASRGDESHWRVLDPTPRNDWQTVVYRFFELFDLANVPCAAQLRSLAEAEQIRVTPPFKPALEEKLWFALFWIKPLEPFWIREIGQKPFEALRRVIPYSWIVDPAPLPAHAVLPRLDANSWDEVAKFSQKQRELILKVSGFSPAAWGSRGVVVASDVSGSDWAQALAEAQAEFSTQPRVLQQFHKGRMVEQPWLNPDTGEIELMKARVRLCPYYFPGDGRVKCAGALATLCPPDKKLIHGMSEAILIPTAISPPPEGSGDEF